MNDSAVANLPASGALTGTELFYADNGTNDVKVTASQIKTFAIGTAASVTGSRTDGTALASLLTVLAAYGLITDNSTP